MKKFLPLFAVLLAGCSFKLPTDLVCHFEQMTITCTVPDAGGAPEDAGSDARDEDAGIEASIAPPDASEAEAPRADSGPDAAKDATADSKPDVVDAKVDVSDAKEALAPQDASTAQRPAGNTGTGFFVSGRKLFDANGNEFRIRGLNHLHFDSPSVGIPKTGANAERWVVSGNAATDAQLAAKSVANKMVPIVGDWDGTCDESPATLSAIVDKWVAQASTWKARERDTLINIANEWGPDDSTVWRDAYVSAVQRMRAAGINSTLVVDSGGCGQALGDLLDFAAAVEAADPQHNVLFDVHLYGFWCVTGCDPSWQFPLAASLDRIVATGLPVVVGEFGPGRSIGPSPTTMTPVDVISAAEARGIGWIAWAWDDPAGEFTSPPMCPPNDTWFALSCTGDYRSNADLTTFGKSVVEDPAWGLKTLAKKASIF